MENMGKELCVYLCSVQIRNITINAACNILNSEQVTPTFTRFHLYLF